MDRLPVPATVVRQSLPDWRIPDDAGIVITHQHYSWEHVSTLRRILEYCRVPVLILADGILEYRNTWEHPEMPDGALFQPLIGHRIACIGEAQARWIESWGNSGVTEVVGIPRLDAVRERQPPTRQADSPFRLLIATANQPAFTPQQRRNVIESLAAVKTWLDANPSAGRRPIVANWRLTDGLAADIGLPLESTEPDHLPSISNTLDETDGTITTPSTLYLESALRKIPTSILDFHNAPHYVPSAWTISAPVHVNQVVRELAEPPPPKLLFQDFVLHDNLSCRTPATPRMITLVTKMIEIGSSCRQQRIPLAFPQHILNHEPATDHRASRPLNLAELYSDNPAFKISDIQQLQCELSQAVKRLESMPRELAEKNEQVSQLQFLLDESRRRVADLRARIFKLRKLLGIGKENQREEDD
jgi:hypothetical protein